MGIGPGADPETGAVFDAEVCDDTGRVAVRLRGFSTRPLVSRSKSPQTLLLTPAWKEEAITTGQAH